MPKCRFGVIAIMGTDNRDAISRRIRALRAKTVENGCTEAEALAAAEMLADLLAKYNMTLDEAELRASPFTEHRETDGHGDFVSDRLWKVADAIAFLTGARYWAERPGEIPCVNFFGFDHEVEVARYLLEICAAAMRREQQRMVRDNWPRSIRRLRPVILPFLDGMADRLRERIRALKPKQPAGNGLIVLHDALVEQAMKDAGISLNSGRTHSSRDLDAEYLSGRAAGDRVALNQGLSGGGPAAGLLR